MGGGVASIANSFQTVLLNLMVRYVIIIIVDLGARQVLLKK